MFKSFIVALSILSFSLTSTAQLFTPKYFSVVKNTNNVVETTTIFTNENNRYFGTFEGIINTNVDLSNFAVIQTLQSDVIGIQTKTNDWNDAFSWGDHAGLYPLLTTYSSFTNAQHAINTNIEDRVGELENRSATDTNLTYVVQNHTNDFLNPHGVTKTQVGLENVDNTSDLDKPISTNTQTALDSKLNISTFTNYIQWTTNTSGGAWIE